MSQSDFSLQYAGECWLARFTAMAGPCEVFMDVPERPLAAKLARIAHREANRIEQKFSRYRRGNIVHKINHAKGKPVEVDEETANVLDYAAQCYALSEGRFDITSGVLRDVWRFDGSDNVPNADAVKNVLVRVGWQKVTWQKPMLTLAPGMEIDLGGIGKEYAVDRSAVLMRPLVQSGVLINFGGDLFALGPRRDGQPWEVGLDDPSATGERYLGKIELSRGGLATSGDARRFLYKDGVRYGHILDPRTGWPVPRTPRSVTVTAPTCMEAGMLATFAMLHGSEAEAFLQAQEIPHRVVW